MNTTHLFWGGTQKLNFNLNVTLKSANSFKNFMIRNSNLNKIHSEATKALGDSVLCESLLDNTLDQLSLDSFSISSRTSSFSNELLLISESVDTSSITDLLIVSEDIEKQFKSLNNDIASLSLLKLQLPPPTTILNIAGKELDIPAFNTLLYSLQTQVKTEVFYSNQGC